jgi:hypothetical protein
VRLPRWDYELGVGGWYDSNLEFVVPDGPGGTAIIPRGGLARIFRGRQSSLRIAGGGSWYGYPDHTEVSRYYAGARLEAEVRSSLSTTWRASGSYDYTYSDSSTILVQQGVVLPLVRTRSYAGDLAFAHKVASKVTLRIEGRAYRTDFDSEGLQRGESYRGTAALDNQLSQLNMISVGYSFEATRAQNADLYYYIHFASLQWRRTLSPRSAFLLEAGGSYTPQPAIAGLSKQAAFFGGATFSRKVKTSKLGLYARREVVPAFGLGVSVLQTRAGMSADIPLGQAWWLSASVDYTLPADVEGTRVQPDATYTYLVLGRRLGNQLTVSGEARYRRRGSTSTFPTIDAVQAGLFFSLVPRAGGGVTRPRPITY